MTPDRPMPFQVTSQLEVAVMWAAGSGQADDHDVFEGVGAGGEGDGQV